MRFFVLQLSRIPILWRAGAILTGLALLTGCVAPDLPPADLAAPGWRIREAAAVWRPRTGAPEVSGELLLAVHPDGQRFVQFSKQALPLITAQSNPQGWRLTSPLRPRPVGGHGRPPQRLLWFQCTPERPAAKADSAWGVETRVDGGWLLHHRRTGESLEVVP